MWGAASLPYIAAALVVLSRFLSVVSRLPRRGAMIVWLKFAHLAPYRSGVQA